MHLIKFVFNAKYFDFQFKIETEVVNYESPTESIPWAQNWP